MKFTRCQQKNEILKKHQLNTSQSLNLDQELNLKFSEQTNVIFIEEFPREFLFLQIRKLLP